MASVEDSQQQARGEDRVAEPGGKAHPGLAHESRSASRSKKLALLHPEPVPLAVQESHRNLQA